MSFAAHNAEVLSDIQKRISVVRRLRTVLSRGRLLNEIARALVVGRLQTCAWITRTAHVQSHPDRRQQEHVPGDNAAAQVALNELARVLLGVGRGDQVRVTQLCDRTNLPTINEIIVRQSATSAWKAVRSKDSPLSNVLVTYDPRTRGASEDLRQPISRKCVAANNLALVWNSSAELRDAETLSKAKITAKKLAQSARTLQL